MSGIAFNKQNEIDFPTFLLQNRNFDTIAEITEVHDFVYKKNFNGADEASFRIYKNKGDEINPYWDDITDHKIIFIPEFQERFEVIVSITEENETIKQCALKSLCESELSQIILRNIEINTKNDIVRNDYDKNFPTVFYRKEQTLRNSSLLHRLLCDKAPHYEIGHVDESLQNMQRTFSFSDIDIYSVLTGDLSNEFHCIFLFDSVNRKINVYDLYNTCNNCGYRGDFTNECPKCHDTAHDFGGQYGTDTTILIDRENLADNISLETNADSMKNCFYVEGGDEVINAALRSINPNGSQYIYHISESMKKDMPTELSTKLSEYDQKYQEYNNTHLYNIDQNVVDAYNGVVDCVKVNFPDYNKKLTSTVTGYASLTDILYNVIDFYDFVNNSMMPSTDTDGIGISDSLSAIIAGFNSMKINNDIVIVLENPGVAIQSTVENKIRKISGVYYSSAYYDIEITTKSYKKADSSGGKDGSWKGNITLTSLTEKDESGNYVSESSEDITIKIPYETSQILDLRNKFIRQQIDCAISEKKSLTQKQITSFSLEEDDFKEKLHLYSLTELNNLLQMFESCLDVILKLDENKEIKELCEEYYNFYSDRRDLIGNELLVRQEQLNKIKALYYFDSSTMKSPSGIIYDLRTETQNNLNIKSFLGNDLYQAFCSYHREDAYSNKNYISDGLTNAEIIQKAKQLYSVASDELTKASAPQYTISASVNNLLAMKEFEPIKDYFAVGNWIHLGIDDDVYKLRLLSYQIHFDDMQTVDVEFSTAEKSETSYSSVEDILNSASSMATSYHYMANQVKASDEINSHVKNWINNGFNATNTIFTNNTNQEVLMDEHGILLRKTLPDLDNQYEPEQIKLLSNGMYITSDNWENIETGIGKISYIDPETGSKVDDYGIIAKTIIGKLFLGENLKIYNDDGSLKFTQDGLKIHKQNVDLTFTNSGLEITNGTNTFVVNPNITNKFLQLSTNINGEKKDVLYTDNKGNLTISGALTSGGTITGTSIYGGMININDKFIVNKDGNVTLPPNATINWSEKPGENNLSGYVTQISKDTIDATYINALKITAKDFSATEITGKTITGGTISIGDNFNVTNSGKLTAKSADLTGNLTAENLKVKDNIYFYIEGETSKYSKMISLELSDFNMGTAYYSLVIGKAINSPLLEDPNSPANFNSVIIKGDLDVKDTLYVKNIKINSSCSLSNAKYIKADLTSMGTCDILGISSSNNLHIGRGLYNYNGESFPLNSDTYINAHDNIYLRSASNSGQICLQIGGETVLEITPGEITSNVPISAPGINELSASVISLQSQVNELTSRITSLENSIQQLKSGTASDTTTI